MKEVNKFFKDAQLINNNTESNESNVWWNLVLIVCVIVSLIALCIVFILCKRSDLNIKGVLNNAVERSEFNPTVFSIYDRSTQTQCDRLIRVRPFDWYIWAIRGDLFILNPEGAIHCSTGTTPAVQVFAESFVETCLSSNYDTILNRYLHLPATQIEYTIKENDTFTILSALNILVDGWITFTTEFVTTNNNNTTASNPLQQKRRRKKRSLAETKITSKMLLESSFDSMKNSRYTDTQLAKLVEQHLPPPPPQSSAHLPKLLR